VDERNREAASLAALKAERAPVTAEGRQAETGVARVAPIRYVAELVALNPLAIALTASVSARRSTAA
jgi:hypothetical protein